MHSPTQGLKGPRERRGRGRWLAAILVAAVVCAGWLVRAKATGDRKSAAAQRSSVPAVRVTHGPLERTIRLTGVTAPERYAAMIVPRLRGSRRAPNASLPSMARASTSAVSSTPKFQSSASGSSGSSSSSSGSTSSSQASSSSSSSSSSATSGTSSSSPAASTSSGGGASSAGSSSSLSTALNRFSTPKSGSSGSSSSSSRAALSSDSDLGSTAANLPGGSNGPPAIGSAATAGDDWHVILQSVVPPGAHVRKGQVVAEFDRQYQLVRLDDFRAAMVSLEQGLKALRQTLDVEARAHKESIQAARAELDKARHDLKTIPVQSDIQAEKLKLAEREAEAYYTQLVKEVELKEAARTAEWRRNTLERDESRIEMARAEANADKMLIRAPIDGTVVMSSIFRGGEFAQIRAGDELHPGMMFLKIVDPSSMVISATVNQTDIDLIRVGAPARVRFDGYPDLELPARVYSVGAMPKTGGFRATYVKEVPVELRLEGLDPRVIPDLSVSVDVTLGVEPAPAVVPLETIFRDPPGTGSAGQPYVFVGSGGTWQRREIEIGMVNNIVAAVRSGLRPGEVIAAARPPQENR